MPTPSDIAVRPFWADLAAYGDRPALVTREGSLSYVELGRRVAAMADELGPTRRLVVLEGAGVDAVVAYLAALAGGHPAILVPDAATVEAYDPDVVCRSGVLDVRREGSAHELHPELALLLSTSGSTGSPKLVRLSPTNLTANAAAIASYLGIRRTDVAPTTLPLHYCYGLSVLNCHLAVGAAVLVTDEPVTSPEFWAEFRSAGCTSLAGVPYSFDLLDRVGFADMELPSLRYLTQAGGRMEPSVVRRYAALGQRRGFDLFVMYGATEATARMAYLPPDQALTHPEVIGVPIPGGSLRIEDGELVYEGANVMLGYAETTAELALGRQVSTLRTGDLAVQRPDGLFEVIGRASRIAKVVGLRIDLDRVERLLGQQGHVVHCVDGGDRLVVAVDVSAAPPPANLDVQAAAAAGLPPARVEVAAVTGVPRLANGKPDYQGILAAATASPIPGPRPDGDLRALYAAVLRRPSVTDDDTFVTLDGDSLSYVEMSVRLEEHLGALPSQWPTMSIRSLRDLTAPSRRRWGRALETSVLLRAAAILLIVTSHTDLISVMGGAHVLLAVLGFNVGRFLMTSSPRATRVRKISTSAARIAVPTVAWLALVAAWDPGVTWRNVILLNGVLGSDDWEEPWQYWFIEASVYLFVALAVVAALPWFDRLERRWPFWVPVGLATIALVTRFSVSGDDVREYRAHIVAWLFLLGWATAKATTTRQRLLVSMLVVATVPGFFEASRTAVVVVGVLLLVWVPSVRVPRLLTAPTATLAGASLAIYLTHWQVYPPIEDAGHHLLAAVAALSVGILLWWAGNRLLDAVLNGALRRVAASVSTFRRDVVSVTSRLDAVPR